MISFPSFSMANLTEDKAGQLQGQGLPFSMLGKTATSTSVAMHRGDSSPKLKLLALIQPMDLVAEFVRSLSLVQPNSLSTGCEFCPLEHGEHGLGGEVWLMFLPC